MHILVPAAPIYALTFLAPIIAGIIMIFYEFVRRFLRKRGMMYLFLIFLGYFGGYPVHTDDHLQLVRTATASIFEPIK